MAEISDNFSTQPGSSGWTSSGLTSTLATGMGWLAATTGGTAGTATQALGTTGDKARICFRIKINKSDTSGRGTWVGTTNSGGEGFAAGYTAGTGICASLFLSGAPYTPLQNVLVADASLVDGAIYTITKTTHQNRDDNSSTCVWGPSGDLIAFVNEQYNVAFGRALPAKAVIWSNSALTSVSNVAFGTSLFGSTTTADNNPYPFWIELFDGSNVRTAQGWLPGRQQTTARIQFVFPGYGSGDITPYATPATIPTTQYPYLTVVRQAIAAGMPVFVLFSNDSSTDATWGNTAGVTRSATFISSLATTLGVTDYKKRFHAFSMGGLPMARMIGEGRATNIETAVWDSAVYDRATFYINTTGSAQTSIQTAMGYTPSSNADAHTAWDSTSAVGLVASNPSRFASIQHLLIYSQTDGVVDTALHGDLFDAAMTAQGIQHTYRRRSYPSHGSVTTPADVSQFIATATTSTRVLVLRES